MKLTRIPPRVDFQIATLSEFNTFAQKVKAEILTLDNIPSGNTHTNPPVQKWAYFTYDGFIYGVNY